MRPLAIAGLAVSLLIATPLSAQDIFAEADVRLLRTAGVATSPAGLVEWVNGLRLSEQTRKKAETLIRQLGEEDFAVREKAAGALVRLGPAVLPLLRKAQASPDPEIKSRAADCVRLLQDRAPDQALVAAAARRLAAADTAETALGLLDLFVALGDEATLPAERFEVKGDREEMADQVRESLAGLLQRSARAAATVKGALGDPLPSRRCAAAVGLVDAGIEGAVPDCRKLLKDKDRGVRLGVAQALVFHRDKSAVEALIALFDVADKAAQRAEELLENLAGDDRPARSFGSAEALRARREGWEFWWSKNASRADLFDWLLGGHVEGFTAPAADATRGYRSFGYETTVPGCKAEVKKGRLVLWGDHGDADQRLFLTARKAIGKARWPAAVDVSVKVGGTALDNVAWHVGVSVGRVKVLFHPGLADGCLRAELTDTHEHLFENEDMGFTPVAGAMHRMTIRVRQRDRGYRFDVTVTEGRGGDKYHKVFDATIEQVGRYDRIGLERSGRHGGNALFESLSIRPGRPGTVRSE